MVSRPSGTGGVSWTWFPGVKTAGQFSDIPPGLETAQPDAVGEAIQRWNGGTGCSAALSQAGDGEALSANAIFFGFFAGTRRLFRIGDETNYACA